MTTTPLTDSLDRVAQEVADLARLGEQMQRVISRLAAGPADPQTLMDAQGADLLSQRLDGLAEFVRALAQAAPSEAVTDVEAAVRALTLADQARRLTGRLPAPEGCGEALTLWD